MKGLLLEFVIIAILMLLNGLFAMSELAIVAAKRVRLEQQAERGSAGARAALSLASNPGDFLSTVQVGITLVGVIASVYGGATIASRLAVLLADVPWLTEHAEGAALVLVVAIITYLSVVIGELVPKQIALGRPERVASLVARPMQFISAVGAPLVRLLTGSTQLILRLFGARGTPEPGLTEDEIHAVIEQGAESGVVPEVEHEIVENVFRLGDRRVSAVMTARPNVEWIDVNASPAEIREAVGNGRIDWVLVCEDDIENVRGIVHTGGLLAQCLDGEPVSLRRVLEEPLFVPSATPVFRVLEMFREKKRHVAVVLDEFGGVDGLVTLSDILSGVIGTSTSHPAAVLPEIVANGDGTWLANGAMDIEKVEDAIGLTHIVAADRRRFRTLGGFLMTTAGRLPSEGEVVSVPGFAFRIESLDRRRIDRVLIERVDLPVR